MKTNQQIAVLLSEKWRTEKGTGSSGLHTRHSYWTALVLKASSPPHSRSYYSKCRTRHRAGLKRSRLENTHLLPTPYSLALPWVGGGCPQGMTLQSDSQV